MRILFIILIGFVSLWSTSCSVQNIYSKGTNYTSIDSLCHVSEYRLKRGDKLSMSVWNHEDLSVGSVYGIINSNEVYGKWVQVEEGGKVALPKIGFVQVEGLTIKEAEDTIANLYAHTIRDPKIILKVHALTVSVLGEVGVPGKIDVSEGKTNLLDALAEVEGFTFYSNKKKIVVQRGTSAIKVDMTKLNSVQLSQVYLLPGDVVYVPTRQGKMIDKKSPNLIPFSGFVTSLVVVLSIF